MGRIMFNPEKDISELEKYGFVHMTDNGAWSYFREIGTGTKPAYEVYITPTHRYLQIKIFNGCEGSVLIIVNSLQKLIYDLTRNGYLIEEEEKNVNN